MENKLAFDPAEAMTAEQVRAMIRKRLRGFRSQAAFAQHCGISAAVLSLTLAGKREPPPALLRCLDLYTVTVYVPMPM